MVTRSTWRTVRVAVATGLACSFSSAIPDAQRLIGTVAPEHYELSFTPDLETERFTGEARIAVQVLTPTSEITMHAVELAITSAAISSGGETHFAQVSANPAAQTITLRSPRKLARGAAELRVTFRGILNRHLRGFYISESGARKICRHATASDRRTPHVPRVRRTWI